MAGGGDKKGKEEHIKGNRERISFRFLRQMSRHATYNKFEGRFPGLQTHVSRFPRLFDK